MLHGVFHSRDVQTASDACDRAIYDEVFLNCGLAFEAARKVRESTFAEADRSRGSTKNVTVKSSPLYCAIIDVVSDASPLSSGESDAIDASFSIMLSSDTSFFSRQCVVKVIMPDRPPPGLCMQLHRAIEKYGKTSLIVFVVRQLSHLDPRLLSRFVRRRCPCATLPSSADRVLATWDALRDVQPHRLYADVHNNSFKMCGTALSVADTALALIDRVPESQRSSFLEKAAEIEALTFRVDKVSLLFDMLGIAYAFAMSEELTAARERGTPQPGRSPRR